MGKREDNALTVFLGVIIGICLPLIFFLVLRLATLEGKLQKSTRENDRASAALYDERKRLEELMAKMKKEKTE